MERVRHYSKPVYQGKWLQRMVEVAEKSAKMPIRPPEPATPVQKVDRRLSPAQIAELVQAYRDGDGTPELRRRYSLSQGSVLKILHSHDVTMRRQGLTGEQIANATDLYGAGQSLAKIGIKLGVEAGTVRRALLKQGVQMRDTHGRQR